MSDSSTKRTLAGSRRAVARSKREAYDAEPVGGMARTKSGITSTTSFAGWPGITSSQWNGKREVLAPVTKLSNGGPGRTVEVP